MLEQFGITQTEEKVYLALLRTGKVPAADLIKKTQLHRTTVYDVLDRLIEKGLVSFIIQNKIKNYAPVNPSKFLDIASEEKKQAEEKEKLAKEIAEKMKAIKQEEKMCPIAQIFVGLAGIKTVMNDIIETKEDFIEFGVEWRFGDVKDLKLYTDKWADQREKYKIHAKMICTEGASTPVFHMNELKYVPKEYQSPATTMVYGDKIAIFLREEPLLIILIESKKLAQSYKNYFSLLWKLAKP